MDKKIAIALVAIIIIVLLVSATPIWVVLHSIFLASDTLYERYNTGDNTIAAIASNVWHAQTFTVGNTGANEDHSITSVKLKLYRSVTPPGAGEVAIYATDVSGKPTGSSLCSVTYNFDNLPIGVPDWIEFIFTPATLSASTQYAIVVSAPDGAAPYAVAWRADSTEPTYTGGSHVASVDSGSSWTLGASDLMFEVYGVAFEDDPPDVTITYTMTVLTIPNNCDVNLLGIGTIPSGNDGTAVFEDLDPETYYLTVSKTDYPTFTKTILVDEDTLIIADLTTVPNYGFYLIIFSLIVALIVSFAFLIYKDKKRR